MYSSYVIFISAIILHVSCLLVEKSGTEPLNPGDMAILFWLTVTNEAMEQVHVEARGERCCDAIDPSDPEACEFMRLTGGEMGTWEPKESRNITLFYATVVPLGRHGHCEVELWYGSEGGETKALNHRVSFDTSVRTDIVPPPLEGIYELAEASSCHSMDMDPLQNCAPVDCRMKYGGVRPFWSNEKQRCVSAPACTDLDQAYDPAANLCRDLRAGLSPEDEELLRRPGAEGQCAASAPNEDFLYTPLVRCHHGQFDPETGLCECDPDWVSSADNIADLQPSTFVVHMCTERKPSCPRFNYLWPILLGALSALLIAGLTLLLYHCWPTPAFCRKPTGRRCRPKHCSSVTINEEEEEGGGRGRGTGESQLLLEPSQSDCRLVPSCPGRRSKSDQRVEKSSIMSCTSNSDLKCVKRVCPGVENRPCPTSARILSSPEVNVLTKQVFSLSRVSTPERRMHKSAPVSQGRRSNVNLSSGSSAVFRCHLKDRSDTTTGFHSSAPPPSIMKSGKSAEPSGSASASESRRRISWAESTRGALVMQRQEEELKHRERSRERRRERRRERSREGSRERSAEKSRERKRARNAIQVSNENARDVLMLQDDSSTDPATWKVSVLWRSPGDRSPSVERVVGAGEEDARRGRSSQDEHTMAATLTARSSAAQSYDRFSGIPSAQWYLSSRRQHVSPRQHRSERTSQTGYTMVPQLSQRFRLCSERTDSENVCYLRNVAEGAEGPSSSYGTFTVCECAPQTMAASPPTDSPKSVPVTPSEERAHKYVVGVRPVGEQGWMEEMQRPAMEVRGSAYQRDLHEETDTAIACESRVCRMCGRHVWIAEGPTSRGGFLTQESEPSLVLCHLCTSARSPSGSRSASVSPVDSDTLNHNQMVYLTVQTHSVSAVPEPIIENLPPCGMLTVQVREQTQALCVPRSASGHATQQGSDRRQLLEGEGAHRIAPPRPPLVGDEDDFWEQFMPKWKDLNTVDDDYDD